MPGRANIVIGGDICPIGRSEKLFEAGDARSIFNDLLINFEQADLTCMDFEDQSFEIIVSWGIVIHIPESEFHGCIVYSPLLRHQHKQFRISKS